VAAGRATELKRLLDDCYGTYSRRAYALRDPVSFTYEYGDAGDGEVAGLVAASLAYGRLTQIMRSVRNALSRLGPSPRRFILGSASGDLRAACHGFVHRTADADSLEGLLRGVREVLEAHGSLRACFLAHDRPAEPTILPGLAGLAAELSAGGRSPSALLADPRRGSACKRWNLFLRWMVRHDEVDPGLWSGVSPARLIVPLDAHMWRVCRELGLTRRATCNMRAALEVTAAFRELCPGDPVRYDFSLMHASAAGRLLADPP
jgi:uncharacterized protein (TIGR02757 family)